jgi:hypothetical protein
MTLHGLASLETARYAFGVDLALEFLDVSFRGSNQMFFAHGLFDIGTRMQLDPPEVWYSIKLPSKISARPQIALFVLHGRALT